jgi:uncharacterized repeat protein (TIGR01451 family)
MTLIKAADKTEAKSGDTITYTIVYKNEGNADAKDVIITDPIPTGTTYIENSVTGGGIYDTIKQEIQWIISVLVRD